MDKINWKLRLQNKATLTALIVAIVTCIYAICAALGIAPSLMEDAALNLIYVVLDAVFAMGIIIDPTTKGIGDSEGALEYKELG